MTVAPEYNTITYTANGTTTNFPWTYDYDETYGTLIVSETTSGTVYTEGTDYTIVDKTVVFNTAPADGLKIKLERNTYRGQQVEFIEGNDFPAKDFGNALDRFAMIEQEQDLKFDNEQTVRAEADATLQENIDSEASSRGSADTGLQNQITAEVSRAKGVEGTLANLTTTNKTDLVSAINEVDGNVDGINGTLSNYGNIVTHNVSEFATAAQGTKADTALQPAALGDATLTIKRNNTSVGTFKANAKTDKDINISVPVNAGDVNALPDTTKYGASINMALNTTDYKLTITLKDQDGNTLNSKTVDFPVENVVVSGSYDSTNQKIILTLVNGNTVEIPVGALISGLQSEITSSNKLASDLVDDTNQTNKFVTSSEKSTWSGKQDTISDLETIRSGAAAGATAVQSTDLATVATSGSYNDLENLPTIGNATITIKQGDVIKGSFTLNSGTDATINLETTEDYSTQSHTWAEGDDTSVEALGGTHSSKGWAEIAEAAASGVQNPANRDLSNLTSIGQMVIDSHNGTMSNCILEIPQNIKLELNNGTLTLKAGSKVYKPNGFTGTIPKFDEVTIANDISGSGNAMKAFANTDGSSLLWTNNVSSGETEPTNPSHGQIWYDTTNNLVKRYSTSTGTWSSGFSLPVALLNPNATSSTTITEMQVFNGACYIGHHVVTYPNVTGLIASGFNADGTLKSIYTYTQGLQVTEHPNTQSVIAIRTNKQTRRDNLSLVEWREKENRWVVKSNNSTYENVPFIFTNASGGVITQFDIVQPVRTATTEMLDNVQSQVDTNTTAIAGKQADVTTLTGYDATQTQTLKNINGVLTWVTD